MKRHLKSFMLNFKQPITTRLGTPIRLYHIYKDVIHGAYKYEDEWIICSWTLPNGFYHKEQGMHGKALDLINNEPSAA